MQEWRCWLRVCPPPRPSHTFPTDADVLRVLTESATGAGRSAAEVSSRLDSIHAPPKASKWLTAINIVVNWSRLFIYNILLGGWRPVRNMRWRASSWYSRMYILFGVYMAGSLQSSDIQDLSSLTLCLLSVRLGNIGSLYIVRASILRYSSSLFTIFA